MCRRKKWPPFEKDDGQNEEAKKIELPKETKPKQRKHRQPKGGKPSPKADPFRAKQTNIP